MHKVDWNEIETVLLDMDGTLLDLHFDNYFWREFVPDQYASKHDISVKDAKAQLFPKFQSAEGTMDWYCVDFWTRELDLDIEFLKHEIKHLIHIHPHAEEFLDTLRHNGHRLVLVTNAHQKSLALKMEMTQLQGHFDKLICSHDFGVPKEDTSFWGKLRIEEPFEADSTLMVDDSLSVLQSARNYGIKHLLAVSFPDSKGIVRTIEDFNSIRDFSEITPVKRI
jgi:putative hydrolase of the HAD superfamily